jgi:hypothetical protein
MGKVLSSPLWSVVPDDLNALVMFETLNDRGLKTYQADLLSLSFVIGCK